MDTVSVRTVAGRRPECVAAHVPECDPLTQSEELGVGRKGSIFDGRVYLDGLTRLAVCLPVGDFQLECVRKCAPRRNEGHHSATSVC